MAQARYSSGAGWIADYTPTWKVYQFSHLKSIDQVEVRPEAVALLEHADIESYWKAKKLPSFILSSNEELMREVFGAMPAEGESRNLLFFKKPGTPFWDESRPQADIQKLRQEMVNTALSMNLEDNDQLVAFVTRFGSFAGHWSYDPPSAGEQSVYLSLFNDSDRDAIIPQFAGIEPLWFLARRIALFRTAKQLAEALRRYDKHTIRSMSDLEPTAVHGNASDGSFVWFRASDVPDSVYRGLRKTGRPRGMLSFKPTKDMHFIVAARMALTGILNEVMEDGIVVQMQHYLREPEIGALRKADPQYLQRSHFRRLSRSSNSGTEEDCDSKPPLFALTYAVQTPEVLAYIDLLNQRTLSAKEMEKCAICSRPFTPRHGNQDRYCRNHTENEKRRHRRKVTREKKAAQDESQAAP